MANGNGEISSSVVTPSIPGIGNVMRRDVPVTGERSDRGGALPVGRRGRNTMGAPS